MNKFLTFYLYQERWYVDLPEWEGSKDDLEMVMGADTLLDIIAQGKESVRVQISNEHFEGWKYRLEFNREEFEGGWYDVSHYSNLISPFECWLCYVTKFVFNNLPQTLYFK